MNSVMFHHPIIVSLTSEKPGQRPVRCSINTLTGFLNHDMPNHSRPLSNLWPARFLTRTMNLKQWRVERAAFQPSEQRPARYMRMTPVGSAGGKDLHHSATHTAEICMLVLILWEKSSCAPFMGRA